MSIPFDIQVDNKVLAFHGPLIYEAKVIKCHKSGSKYVETDQGNELIEDNNIPPDSFDQESYLLHYKGWKNKWDEWVPRDRVMEFNESNVKKMEDLIKAKNKKRSSPGLAAKKVKKSNGPPRTIAKDDTKIKKKKHDIILPMSQALKYLLVDDWELITKDRRIVTVPSKNPVNSILEDYLRFVKSKKTPEQLDISQEVVSGLRQYFNMATRLALFYKYERLQYGNLLKEHGSIDLCEYYGIEHLLRLFVSLPGLISDTSMDGPSIEVLIRESAGILQYLDGKFMEYLNDYEYTTPSYDNLARS